MKPCTCVFLSVKLSCPVNLYLIVYNCLYRLSIILSRSQHNVYTIQCTGPEQHPPFHCLSISLSVSSTPYSAGYRGGSMRIRRPSSATQPKVLAPPTLPLRTNSVSAAAKSSNSARLSGFNTIGPTSSGRPPLPPELLNLKREHQQWDCK